MSFLSILSRNLVRHVIYFRHVSLNNMDTLQNLSFYIPSKEDGWAVSQLINACPPLDSNSVYCNLLQCYHFANTSVAVKLEKELIGFTSGYLVPDRPDTLFLWQMAVDEKMRGCGLASRMIVHILQRQHCESVQFIETTITEANKASWALFQGIANYYGSSLSKQLLFDKEKHFSGHHDSEVLVRIGPLSRALSKAV